MKVVKVMLNGIRYLIGAIMMISIIFLRWDGYSIKETLVPSVILFLLYTLLFMAVIFIEEAEIRKGRK